MENVEYGEILRLVLEKKLHMELITYQSQAKNCDVNYFYGSFCGMFLVFRWEL